MGMFFFDVVVIFILEGIFLYILINESFGIDVNMLFVI